MDPRPSALKNVPGVTDKLFQSYCHIRSKHHNDIPMLELHGRALGISVCLKREYILKSKDSWVQMVNEALFTGLPRETGKADPMSSFLSSFVVSALVLFSLPVVFCYPTVCCLWCLLVSISFFKPSNSSKVLVPSSPPCAACICIFIFMHLHRANHRKFHSLLYRRPHFYNMTLWFELLNKQIIFLHSIKFCKGEKWFVNDPVVSSDRQ